MMQGDNELTLTGATLTSDNGVAADKKVVEMTALHDAHNHHHGDQCNHDHSHGHAHSHNNHIPKISPAEMQEQILKASPQDQFKALSTLIRLGTFEAFETISNAILEKQQDGKVVFETLGEDGHSLLHWAAKRVDDIQFLSWLCQHVSRDTLDISSKDGAAGMRPLHWACTEGSIPHVAMLLRTGASLESTDNSGCTPLLIAAQYGHAECVAFLHIRGANLEAMDNSLDSALHWAAYKGSMPVCGLLLFQGLRSHLLKQDAFGQTPLHLASLRGNTSVVRYLLDECSSVVEKKSLLTMQDNKSKTCLDLAIQKQRPSVQSVLRQAMDLHLHDKNHFKCISTQCRQLLDLHAWKVWFGCASSMDEVDEAPKLPFYITIIHMAMAGLWYPLVFTPLHVGRGVLWDHGGLHLFTFCCMAIMWWSFWKTYTSNPGLLDDGHAATPRLRRLYEQTLESYATSETTHKSETQLCHSCHIARPLRSKHCRVSRKCVLMFDHFCPFVGNTIGLDNYRYFYIFLLSLALACVGFFTTWIIYMHRMPQLPIKVLLAGLYLGLFFLMDMGMLIYHTQLSLVNLTTNEHQNLARYKYLQNERGGYRNPFFKGLFWNCVERFFPGEQSYALPEEQTGLLRNQSAATDNNVDGDIV